MNYKQENILNVPNKKLQQLIKVVNKKQSIRRPNKDEPLRVGVDLGTSSIVLTVLDSQNEPLYCAFEYDNAIRDGIIVDFMDSVKILKNLKQQAEQVLGRQLLTACGAIPPDVDSGSGSKVVTNVIESAGFSCRQVVAEPTAAAKFLQIKTGTVVDIGGGTTGISVFNNNKLVQIMDEPTGGIHMTLVIAGAYQINSDKAEVIKREHKNEDEVFHIIQPVVEKMAIITKNVMKDKIYEPVIIVGGAINFKDFIPTFSKILGIPTIKPLYPQFVTPLGIAMCDS
ncbi:ethanolamine utilization protein EutJ [Lactobacillus mellis]|nr:ethanolamine utilization protein EutJ [Bombilactobacillus mellis]